MKKNRCKHLITIMAVALTMLVGTTVQSVQAVEIDQAAINAAVATAVASGVDPATAAENAVRDAAEAALNSARTTDPNFATSIETIAADIIGQLCSMSFDGMSLSALFAAATEGVTSSAAPEEVAAVNTGMRNAAESIAAASQVQPSEEEITVQQCSGIPPENQLVCVLVNSGAQAINLIAGTASGATGDVEGYEPPEGFERAGQQNRNRNRAQTRLRPVRDNNPGSRI